MSKEHCPLGYICGNPAECTKFELGFDKNDFIDAVKLAIGTQLETRVETISEIGLVSYVMVKACEGPNKYGQMTQSANDLSKVMELAGDNEKLTDTIRSAQSTIKYFDRRETLDGLNSMMEE